MNEKVYIFFDEFGNSHLNFDKQGSFSHYVYTAILIKESEIDNARKKRDELSKKYFQGSDIKSKNIKNNEVGFQKRLNTLKCLKELNFTVYSLVINKKELNSKGLSYKQIFIKYFQKVFVKRFVKTFDAFEIVADEIGHPEFKTSLATFINSQIQRNLFFPDRYYRLADDFKDEKLIQLADFLSGCVGKMHCISHIHPKADLLYDLIKDRLFVEFYPYQKSYFYVNLPENHTELDNKVKMISVDLALQYLDSGIQDDTYHSVDVLNHLLLSFKVSPNRLVERYELINVISRIDVKYSEQNLRQAISFLRDRGVLIVSIQGRSGYKIPNKLEDICGFYNRYLNSIVPMINRIRKSNDLLKFNSVNEVNLLELDESFDVLTKLIGVLEQN